MEKVRLIVAGSRTIVDYGFVRDEIEKFLGELFDDYLDDEIVKDNLVVVSGRAKGVDRLGEAYATIYGVEIDIYPADWDKFGKRAGFMRNVEMAENATHCLVICENGSNGSMHMFETAESNGLITKLVEYKRK